MSEIVRIKERVLNNSLTLEEYMGKLCQYGKPGLRYFGNGEWYCNIDMFVQGTGVEFKIASSFKETSMLNAAKVYYERLEKALSDLGQLISE